MSSLTSAISTGLPSARTFIALMVFTMISLPPAYVLTYRKALATGRNSFVMQLLGRRGCLLMSRLLAKVSAGNPQQVRQRMRLEAQERFMVAKGDVDAQQGGGICFVGSSTFTYWTRLKRDMSPLLCYNLAFGGSITTDLLEHIDVFCSYRPKVIVYYCGANDLSLGRSAKETADGFIAFVREIRKKLPDTGFVYLCTLLTPLQQYQGNTEKLNTANELVKLFIDSENNQGSRKQMAFVNANQDERFQTELTWYLNDGLHLNDIGHQELGHYLKPKVEAVYNAIK